MMNRGYTVEEYMEFIDRCRHYLDEPEKGRPLMLSGDFIVGFPTETEEDYQTTIDVVRKVRYKNSFIFKYSPRPGTIAFDKIADDVAEDVKKRRNNELLGLQNSISHEISREQIGRTFDCLVEGYSRRELKKSGLTAGQMRQQGAVAITVGGRTLAPVIDEPTDDQVQLACRTDGDQIVMVDVPGRRASTLVGTILRARITGAHALSLTGELLATQHPPL
jgi:tRNA-2-methylthio-N6-dimethylallyladenosine synthase